LEAKAGLQYSVVVPVYNGASSLEELSNGIIAALQKHSFEIVFVEDAGTDQSWEIITQLKNRHPFVTALQHSVNKGQSASLRTGFAASKGAYIITIDDDLQYNPLDIPRLIQKQKTTGADIVYGLPVKPAHSFLRNWSSAVMKTAGRYAGYRFKGSSFRLMKRTVSMKLAEKSLPKSSLLEVLLYRSGFTVEQVAVPHYRRRYGKSNYSFFSLAAILTISFATHCRLLFSKKPNK